jgi:hypothetical protein
MSDTADIAARTQRFNEAVRTFTPSPPARHVKLIPLKEGIIELRQKGASFRLIRELLATVGVAVGTDTIMRFLAEVTGEAEPATRRKRPNTNRRSGSRSIRVQPIAQPEVNPPTTPVNKPNTNSTAQPPFERSRTRGPRVADPNNL